ncbi:MAG: hypothetical protein IJ155_04385 [Prevotella sp.]|nr:hypothetical protein [Prevotella sp.]
MHRCKDLTKVVLLRFKREELLYDIGNYSYVEGDIMQTQDEHERHQVIDVVEDGNVDRVTRVLDLAFAQCVELCYPYSKVPVEDGTELDDTKSEPSVYELRLRLPDGFSQTTVTLLEKLIHELLVYKVMADWMSITKPTSKQNWEEKIQEIEGQVIGTLNCRRGRVRRTQTPF